MTQQDHVGAHRRAPFYRRAPLIDVRPAKQQRGAPKTKNALNPSETVQPWENRSAIAHGLQHNIPDKAHHPKADGRIGKGDR